MTVALPAGAPPSMGEAFAHINSLTSPTVDDLKVMVLIEAAGLLLNERVEIYNIDNGERFATYVIEGVKNSGVIGLNGAVARKACVGDKLIICSYCSMPPDDAKAHVPKVVLCGPKNKIEKKKKA